MKRMTGKGDGRRWAAVAAASAVFCGLCAAMLTEGGWYALLGAIGMTAVLAALRAMSASSDGPACDRRMDDAMHGPVMEDMEDARTDDGGDADGHWGDGTSRH